MGLSCLAYILTQHSNTLTGKTSTLLLGGTITSNSQVPHNSCSARREGSHFYVRIKFYLIRIDREAKTKNITAIGGTKLIVRSFDEPGESGAMHKHSRQNRPMGGRKHSAGKDQNKNIPIKSKNGKVCWKEPSSLEGTLGSSSSLSCLDAESCWRG